MVKPHLRRRANRIAAVAAGGLLLALVVPAAQGSQELYVAADAPQRSDAMTIVMGVKNRGLLGGDCDGVADVQIGLAGNPVLFKGVRRMLVAGCRGQVEVPYDLFAIDNGQYDVHVTFNGLTATTYVNVLKHVKWVYVRAFDDPSVAGRDNVRIDVSLDRVQGQPLASGVFASGDLVIEIHLERCAPDPAPLPGVPVLPISTPCGADGRDVHKLAYRTVIPVRSQASLAVILPISEIRHPDDASQPAPSGDYNVTATFHNDEALGNANVPMDPTVYREDPPANWFRLERR